MIALIEGCETSKEVMDKLDSNYGRKSEIDKMLVHEKFHTYKMDSTDSVGKHVAKIENLEKFIRDSGDNRSEEAIMTKILGTLSPKFGSVRQA